MAFGKKKPEGKTVLLLDVESGSVGGGLLRLTPGSVPKLFGELRVGIPLLSTRNSESLAHYIEKATGEVLHHTSTVAARLRNNKDVGPTGVISSAAVFLGAPWGAPDLQAQMPRFAAGIRSRVGEEISAHAGYIPTTFNTSADAVAYGARAVLLQEKILLCLVRGEMAELLLIGERSVLGYATIPGGARNIARTLKVHADIPESHVTSLLSLSQHATTVQSETLDASARHFVEQFSGAAQELLAQVGATNVYVIGDSPTAEWFAQTLGDAEQLSPLFPQGGVVRSLQAHHFFPHIDVRKNHPDLYLMMAALFADGALGGL